MDKDELSPEKTTGVETLTESNPEPQNLEADSPVNPPEAEPQPQAVPPVGPPVVSPPSPHSAMSEAEPQAGFPQTPPQTTQAQVQKGFPFFKYFLIVGIIVVVGIYAIVAYIYFGNANLQNGAQVQETFAVPTPTPKIDYEIANGSVVAVDSAGKTEVIIDKKDYEGTGITGFIKVSQSPNNSYLCFEAWPPAPDPSLYYSKITGEEVSSIGSNYKSCYWSAKSDKLAFTNYQKDGSPVDIFVWDLSSKTQTNLTKSATDSATIRLYEIVGWSSDDAKIACNYQDVDTKNTAKEILGECEINVATSRVTELGQTPSSTPSATPKVAE